MTQDSILRTRQFPRGAGEISVADTARLYLDEDLVRLDLVQVDLGELEGAVEAGSDEGCCCPRHGRYMPKGR